jgi:hypothetical protein
MGQQRAAFRHGCDRGQDVGGQGGGHGRMRLFQRT